MSMNCDMSSSGNSYPRLIREHWQKVSAPSGYDYGPYPGFIREYWEKYWERAAKRKFEKELREILGVPEVFHKTIEEVQAERKRRVFLNSLRKKEAAKERAVRRVHTHFISTELSGSKSGKIEKFQKAAQKHGVEIRAANMVEVRCGMPSCPESHKPLERHRASNEGTNNQHMPTSRLDFSNTALQTESPTSEEIKAAQCTIKETAFEKAAKRHGIAITKPGVEKQTLEFPANKKPLITAPNASEYKRAQINRDSCLSVSPNVTASARSKEPSEGVRMERFVEDGDDVHMGNGDAQTSEVPAHYLKIQGPQRDPYAAGAANTGVRGLVNGTMCATNPFDGPPSDVANFNTSIPDPLAHHKYNAPYQGLNASTSYLAHAAHNFPYDASTPDSEQTSYYLGPDTPPSYYPGQPFYNYHSREEIVSDDETGNYDKYIAGPY